MASVTLTNLRKVYPNGFEAVHDLDREIGRRSTACAGWPFRMWQDNCVFGWLRDSKTSQAARYELVIAFVNDVFTERPRLAMVSKTTLSTPT